VAVITILASAFSFVLHWMLGQEAPATYALGAVLMPTLVANLILAFPVYLLVRAAVRERDVLEAAPEVEVLV
jgi:hypothetical protein